MADIIINGKTPEEIKKDAETCMNHPYMDTCNSCRLYKECHGISDHIVKELYDLVLHYESRLAQAERERDAAVADMTKMAGESLGFECRFCRKLEPIASPCLSCEWQWRGVCEQNTKEENAP